jgi:hypothetical protein
MIGLWLAHRAISRRSDVALVGSAAALGLALQTHVSALTVGPGVLAALLLPRVVRAIRGGSGPVWPLFENLLAAAGATVLMVANLLIYNLTTGPATASTTGNRIERYVGDDAWSLAAWGERLAGLLQAAALAVSSVTTEVELSAAALLSPMVIVSVALVLVGLWTCARRGVWLPLLVTLSVLLSVSLLNGRVEPIVPRVRHYMTLVPLGTIMIAVAVVWLHDRVTAWQRDAESDRATAQSPTQQRRGAGIWGGAWLARAGLVLVPLLLAGGSLASYGAYEAERLSRPDKNNAAFLAVLEAVATSGTVDERLYLDAQLVDLLTMSGGRMLTHLRYAFLVRGQEVDVIDVDDDRLPIGQRGNISRRLVLSAETVSEAEQRYRLVPLPGEPGEGAPLRAFRAFPLHEQ